MNIRTSDRLEPLGIACGALLVLVGIGTLVGTPWAYKSGVAVLLGQVVGALAAVAIGIALVWVVRT